MPRRPYYPPGSPERKAHEEWLAKDLMQRNQRNQMMADKARYQSRVFDQQSADLARQQNKEFDSGTEKQTKKEQEKK